MLLLYVIHFIQHSRFHIEEHHQTICVFCHHCFCKDIEQLTSSLLIMLVVKLLYINPWDPLRSKAYETGTWYQPVFLKIFPYHLRTHQTYFLETNKNKRIIVCGLFYGIKDPLIVIKNIPSIFHHEISRISNTDLKSQLLFDATKPANWCNNNFKINVTMKRYVCISIFIHDVTPKESWVSFKKMNRKYETVLRQVYEYNVKNIHWFGCLPLHYILQQYYN